MIALGGALGVGLFLGSGRAIQDTGPSLILCYLVAGAVIFLMMRALGELALYRPVAGSFASYAEEFLGRRLGFITGWTYWLTWVVTAMAEITAAGIYVQFWFPDIPQWVTALVIAVVLYGLNLVSVALFGEVEFWLALIKVVTVVVVIVIGSAVLAFRLGPLGDSASVDNLWDHNFVVLTAATSACDSGIFSSGRMLYTLAEEGEAPRRFGQLSNGTSRLLVGVVINYLVPEQAFTYITSVATVGALWTWGVIVAAHLSYRRRVREGAV